MEFEIYNPQNKDVDTLPTIYGFNNGGASGFMHAQLITEDGYGIGSHLCSHEGFMPGDLGCVKGSRSDRHEAFQEHYPNGYKMEFVPSSEQDAHTAFQSALHLAIAKQDDKGGDQNVKVEIEFA